MADSKNLKVTQVRSQIGFPRNQRETLKTLKLKHIGDSSIVPNNKAMQGMIHTVRHLVECEEA